MDSGAQSRFTLGEEARRAVLTSILETWLQKHITRKLKKAFTAVKRKPKGGGLHVTPSPAEQGK